MTASVLVIGNRNYSSWSLRPWLALRTASAEFDVEMIALQTPSTKERISKHSPSGMVPVLIEGNRTIWDSLAICEYVAERFPDAGLWPADTAARAHARSVSAEMHSGFAALRSHMPMNIRARHPGCGGVDDPDTGVAANIERIDEIWRECRTRHAGGGPFLFGGFTIADCMFAPVVFRFLTYEPALSPAAEDYVAAMLANPAMKEWEAAAVAESERVASHDERYA